MHKNSLHIIRHYVRGENGSSTMELPVDYPPNVALVICAYLCEFWLKAGDDHHKQYNFMICTIILYNMINYITLLVVVLCKKDCYLIVCCFILDYFNSYLKEFTILSCIPFIIIDKDDGKFNAPTYLVE